MNRKVILAYSVLQPGGLNKHPPFLFLFCAVATQNTVALEVLANISVSTIEHKFTRPGGQRFGIDE